MLRFIGENIVLILCSLLTVFATVISLFNLLDLKSDKPTSCKKNPKKKAPVFGFGQISSELRGFWRKLFLASLIVLFIGVYSIGLHKKMFGAAVSLLLSIPLTAVTVAAAELFLMSVSFLLRKWIHIEQKRFNLIYSFSFMQLILLGIFLCMSGQNLSDTYTFSLAVFNLLFCYLFAVFGLYLLLKEASSQNTSFTLRSVWKAALLQIVLFLLILTFLSYFGFLHNPNSYQTPDGAFSFGAAFYHIAVTFGTVGYGDIIPLSGYTRTVSVLTVFASIMSLTVMMSAVLSLSGHLRHKEKPSSKKEVLDKNFATDGDKQNSAD